MRCLRVPGRLRPLALVPELWLWLGASKSGLWLRALGASVSSSQLLAVAAAAELAKRPGASVAARSADPNAALNEAELAAKKRRLRKGSAAIFA